MPITPDEIKIIKRAIHYSVLAKQEVKNDDEFRDLPSIKGRIDTEIHFKEQFSNELENKTEESLVDNDILCSSLSSAISFLTGYHYGRRVSDEMEEDIELIKKIQKYYCTKKPHEYIG